MFKIIVSFAAVCTVFGFSPPLLAETVTATGTIESVDAGNRTITVRRKTFKGEKTAELAVGAKAEIVVEGQPSTLASLKAGQSVAITYDTAAKQLTGISVGSGSTPSSGGRESNGASPPADAAAFEGHSYKFFREVMTWHQAKSRCEELGGHLAVVGGDAENNFIMALAKSGIGNLGKQNGVWLGATDEGREGDWRWIDGSRLRFTNWLQQPKQPNNAGGDEHYLWMWLAQHGVWTDQADQPKEMTAYFVCEWDQADIGGRSLIHGDTLDGWRAEGSNDTPKWMVENGALVNYAQGPSLATSEEFDDYDLHLEFSLPPECNSGVYLRGRYEIQLIDSAVRPQGRPLKQAQRCGAIYGQTAPSRDVYKGANQWNSLDVRIEGKTVTVRMNDVTIINRAKLKGPTDGDSGKGDASRGPIVLQSHGVTGAKFRNITITLR